MFSVAVKQDFIAQHFLIGGDWGLENQKHSHHYWIELELQGKTLDEHGYLVDIVDIKDNLEKLIAYFRDKTLNEVSEFKGINPSIEHLAHICHRMLSDRIQSRNVTNLTVRIWEDNQAWAAYSGE